MKGENETEIRTVIYNTVITSVGYQPAPLARESSSAYLVGDCKQVGNLRSVIWLLSEIKESYFEKSQYLGKTDSRESLIFKQKQV